MSQNSTNYEEKCLNIVLKMSPNSLERMVATCPPRLCCDLRKILIKKTVVELKMYNKIHGNAFEDIQKYWKKFNSNKEVEEEFHDARSE